jgi:hypothetical protein
LGIFRDNPLFSLKLGKQRPQYKAARKVPVVVLPRLVHTTNRVRNHEDASDEVKEGFEISKQRCI